MNALLSSRCGLLAPGYPSVARRALPRLRVRNEFPLTSVQIRMRGDGQCLQVFRPVVVFLAVLVVYMLVASQQAAVHPFPHQAVFEHVPALFGVGMVRRPNIDIAARVNPPPPLPGPRFIASQPLAGRSVGVEGRYSAGGWGYSRVVAVHEAERLAPYPPTFLVRTGHELSLLPATALTKMSRIHTADSTKFRVEVTSG